MVYLGPDTRGVTFVASQFPVVSKLGSYMPSMLFERNNSVFRGVNKEKPVLP